MLETSNNSELPSIPNKRYFTIGEVSDLCDVKPHVLRSTMGLWGSEVRILSPRPIQFILSQSSPHCSAAVRASSRTYRGEAIDISGRLSLAISHKMLSLAQIFTALHAGLLRGMKVPCKLLPRITRQIWTVRERLRLVCLRQLDNITSLGYLPIS